MRRAMKMTSAPLTGPVQHGGSVPAFGSRSGRSKSADRLRGRVIRFCCYHALELYLKALLRQKHGVEKIRESSATTPTAAGGSRDARTCHHRRRSRRVRPDRHRTHHRSRYTRTGAKHWPEPQALLRTCNRVRDSARRSPVQGARAGTTVTRVISNRYNDPLLAR